LNWASPDFDLGRLEICNLLHVPAAAQRVWVFDPPILPDGSDVIFLTIDFLKREVFMTEARTKDRPSLYAADDTQRIGIGLALVLAVAAALGVHTLVSAPAMREAAEAELARVIADEDRDVCGQFGLRPGKSAFAACSRELDNVRRKQSDRDQAAAAGIL
jgi:hypothetical protein